MGKQDSETPGGGVRGYTSVYVCVNYRAQDKKCRRVQTVIGLVRYHQSLLRHTNTHSHKKLILDSEEGFGKLQTPDTHAHTR